VHGAGWVAVNVWPAIVSEPTRWAVVVLAEALKFTVPLPVPLVAFVIDSHAALETADHAQPDAVVIATEPLPPVAATVCAAGLIANAHDAACVTVSVCPAIVRVPTRCAVVVFAATVNVAVPPPVPLAALVIDSHPALATADHAQPDAVVIAAEPLPPLAANA